MGCPKSHKTATKLCIRVTHYIQMFISYHIPQFQLSKRELFTHTLKQKEVDRQERRKWKQISKLQRKKKFLN